MKKLVSIVILLIFLLLLNTAAGEKSLIPATTNRSPDTQYLSEEKPGTGIPEGSKEEGSYTKVNESGNTAGKPEQESVPEKVEAPPAANSSSTQSQTPAGNAPTPGSTQEAAPLKMSDVLFLGDSITEGLAIYNYFPMAVHMGINALSVNAALGHVDEISAHNPKEIFILLGTNDLWGQMPVDTFVAGYANLLKALKGKCPASKIFVQSVFPVGEAAMARNSLIDNNIIDRANAKLKAVAEEYGCTYVDINSLLKDENNNLHAEYTFDGVHVFAQYYHIWTDAISGFIPGA